MKKHPADYPKLEQQRQALLQQLSGLREVRRGWFADVEVVLVVDEFAETLHPIRRPALSSSTERRVRADMAAALRTRRGFANR